MAQIRRRARAGRPFFWLRFSRSCFFVRAHPKGPLAISGLLFTALVFALTGGQYWTDAYGYPRVLSPLLILIALPSDCKGSRRSVTLVAWSGPGTRGGPEVGNAIRIGDWRRGSRLAAPQLTAARRNCHMRVLLVSDYATPTGGAELMILALRDLLRRRGHDARLLASSARPLNLPSQADYECFGISSAIRGLNSSG